MNKYMSLVVIIITVGLILGACSPKDDMQERMNDDVTNEIENNDETMDDIKDDFKDDMTNDGEIAPMFVLNDSNGSVHSLADLKGKKVYIKYWASWCSICLAGLEETNELSKDNTDFVVLTIIAPDHRGEQSTEDFNKWFNSLEYTDTIVLFDIDGEYKKKFGIVGYPTSIYIGSDGVLVNVIPGHKSNDAIKEAFTKIY